MTALRMQARYCATARGSSILEHLISDGEPVMTTVYHLDKGTLRMTHHREAGNQPRLKSDKADASSPTVHFSLDTTNLPSPTAPHVDALDIQTIDADHIVLTFTFVEPVGVSHEKIDLRRVKPAA